MKHGNERISREKKYKILITVLSLLLAATIGVNASLAFVMSKTASIVNTFVPEIARVELDINARLLNRLTGEERPPEGFVFILSDSEGIELRRSDATGTDGNAAMYFDYSLADEGNTYNYVLTELYGGTTVGSIEYDGTVYDITVTVFRDGQGSLDASISGAARTNEPPANELPSGSSAGTDTDDDPEGSNESEQSEDTDPDDDTEELTESEQSGNNIKEPVYHSFSAQFTNYYDPAVAVETIVGKKILAGRTMSDKEFKFRLYKTDSAYNTDRAALVETAENDGSDGSFAFMPLTFIESGTYYYAVVEDISSPEPYVTYDTSQYNIEITVDLSGDAPVVSKTIRKDGEDTNAVQFSNTYDPPVLSCSVPVSITKTIKDNDKYKLPLNDFEFILLNTTEKVTITAKTDKDGKAEIVLNYDEIDIGRTYSYKLTEKAGSKAGMTYSNESYSFDITIRKGSDDQLVPEIKIGGKTADKAAFSFENAYTPPSDDKPDNKPGGNDGKDPGSNDTPSDNTHSNDSGKNQQPTNTGIADKPQQTEGKETTPNINNWTGDNALITLNIVLLAVCLIVMIWMRALPPIKKKQK